MIGISMMMDIPKSSTLFEIQYLFPLQHTNDSFKHPTFNTEPTRTLESDQKTGSKFVSCSVNNKT